MTASVLAQKRDAVKNNRRLSAGMTLAWILVLSVIFWLQPADSSGTAAVNLTGTYTAKATVIVESEDGSGTPSTLALEIKMNLVDTGAVLNGDLTFRGQNWLVWVSFPVSGTYKVNAAKLRLKVNMCLESPTVSVNTLVLPDGSLSVASGSILLTCNFGQVRMIVPDNVRLNR